VKAARREEVGRELEDPKIWDDPKRAQELGKEKKQLDDVVVTLTDLGMRIADSDELFVLARSDSDDATMEAVAGDIVAAQSTIEMLEFRRMFSHPLDANSCFVDIQAGSGGTEAQDWASIKVTGDYAFGHLRTETGVHRLVRKSPYDSNARRHTSFASVFVYPEIDDSIVVDINPADLRIDTFRASGAGGQHINKTDSAVRITHLPTNIVVQCQNDRSQHRNRAEAMAMLKAKLYELELRKRQEQQQKLEDTKTDIGWGHQIRSYVLDQSRIKDLRTNYEVGNTQAILDGELDDFIAASLKQGVQ